MRQAQHCAGLDRVVLLDAWLVICSAMQILHFHVLRTFHMHATDILCTLLIERSSLRGEGLS